MDLFEYFKTQFSDLEGAKKWYYKWKYEWDQDIPDHPEWSFSLRAMARHISWYLEGKKGNYQESYLDTKYGSELYWI